MADRRVIRGIIHVIESGGRWVDAPSVYGSRKTLYNRFRCWAAKGVCSSTFHALPNAGGSPAHLLIDSSAVRAHRSAAGGKGELNRVIGRSRGGRTAKIHALTDELCRPVAFLLIEGQIADCKAGRGHREDAADIHAER